MVWVGRDLKDHLEETTDVTMGFLKLQATSCSVLPGKTQHRGISTEGSQAAGCAVLAR